MLTQTLINSIDRAFDINAQLQNEQIKAALQGILDSRNYKEYVAIVSQTGTSAPTSVVLQNDFDVVPAWVYNDSGEYSLTATGLFTLNKTFCMINNPARKNNNAPSFDLGRASANIVFLESYNSSGTKADAQASSLEILIRVYN